MQEVAVTGNGSASEKRSKPKNIAKEFSYSIFSLSKFRSWSKAPRSSFSGLASRRMWFGGAMADTVIDSYPAMVRALASAVLPFTEEAAR